MGLFGNKKVVETKETIELNQLLTIALEMDQTSGTWRELPEDIATEKKDQVIEARKIIFEYIRQLKAAGVYGNGAVQKFAKESYSWVNKSNIQTFIQLGSYL